MCHQPSPTAQLLEDFKQQRCQLSSTFMLADLVIVLSSLLRSRGDAVQIRIHLFGKGGGGHRPLRPSAQRQTADFQWSRRDRNHNHPIS